MILHVGSRCNSLLKDCEGRKQGCKRQTSWEDGCRVLTPWHFQELQRFLAHQPFALNMQAHLYISVTVSMAIEVLFHAQNVSILQLNEDPKLPNPPEVPIIMNNI